MLACVTLHNMLRTACADDAALGDRADEQHNLIPGSWRDGAVLDDLERRLYGNNTSRAVKRHRLYLKHYYNEEAGSTLWQCGSGVWCSDGAVQCLLIVTVESPFHKLIGPLFL